MSQTSGASDTQTQERPSSALTQETLPVNPAIKYPGGYVDIPVANGITFSTANFAQALLLQYIYPGLRIRTPFTINEFSSFWTRNEMIRKKAYELRNHLLYSEASREPIESILSSIYQHITSSLQSPPPVAQLITPEEKSIAEALLRIYFETLALTLGDITRVISKTEIDIQSLDEERIKLILKEKINLAGHKSPICLQAVLPYSKIFLDAVELCREQASWKIYFINALKKLWHSLGNFFNVLLSRPTTNFLPSNVQNQDIPASWEAGAQTCPHARAVPTIHYNSPFTTPKPTLPHPPRPTQNAVLKHTNHRNHNNDDDNDEGIVEQPPALVSTRTISIPQHLRSLRIYKNAISKTLDQYISGYKMSPFGHHHDNRARAVKNAIEQSPSFENIYTILKRQEVIFSPERKRLAIMSSQELQKYARIPENMIWRNLSERQRWNGFFDVVHYTDPEQSGYYRVIQEALAIDPYDASLPLRYGLT